MTATNHNVYLKHTGSGAHDSAIDYDIDEELKTVTVTRIRLRAGKEGISSQLAGLIFDWLPRQHEIIAFNDETGKGWTGKPGKWFVFVKVNSVTYRAESWLQWDQGRCVELYPTSSVESNPQRMSGAVCVAGTRVPAMTIFESLADGMTIDEIVDAFPSLSKEMIVAVILEAGRKVGSSA